MVINMTISELKAMATIIKEQTGLDTIIENSGKSIIVGSELYA